jgi:hypothetical protein
LTGEDLARSAPMLCVTPQDGRKHHGGIYVLSSWTLAQLSNSDKITGSQLNNGLTRLENSICLHTSTQPNSVVPKGGYQADPTQFPFHKSQLDTLASTCNKGACRVCCTFAQFCADIHCYTCWTIYRRHNDTKGKLDEVVLSVKRQVCLGTGLDTTPKSPTWLSQMQMAEKVDPESRRQSVCVDGETFLKKYDGEIEPMRLYARSQGNV